MVNLLTIHRLSQIHLMNISSQRVQKKYFDGGGGGEGGGGEGGEEEEEEDDDNNNNNNTYTLIYYLLNACKNFSPNTKLKSITTQETEK